MLTHHAYLIEDSTSLFDVYVNGIRAAEKFDAASPDFFSQKYEKFGIEEARELSARALLKKLSRRSLLIIGISSITTEAQQALLKLFEEPQEGLTFILITPPGLFIPTLKSRFLPYETETFLDDKRSSIYGTQARAFLASPHTHRSKIVADMLDDDETDVKERVRDFLDAVEAVLYMELHKTADKSKQDILDGLTDIAHFRQYLGDRAPSLKMILEHFAATLPKI